MRDNETIAKAVEAGQWDRVIDYVVREVFDKPDEYYTLDKLRKAAAGGPSPDANSRYWRRSSASSRVSSPGTSCWKKSSPSSSPTPSRQAIAIPAIKTFFKAYVTSNQIRHIVDTKDFTSPTHHVLHPRLQGGAGQEIPRRCERVQVRLLNQFSA